MHSRAYKIITTPAALALLAGLAPAASADASRGVPRADSHRAPRAADGAPGAPSAVTPAGAGSFSSVRPARLLDTRAGTGAPAAAVPAHGTVTFGVLGRGGIPASGVGAVVLTVTVDRPVAAGYVTTFPAGATRPSTSNLNFTAAQTVANLAVVRPGSSGRVSLYNGSAATVELIADVSAYARSGAPSTPGAFGAVTPTRLLDTRTGSGAPVAAGQSVTVDVDGVAGVPASGVSAVVVNVTATRASAPGYLSAYADGTAPPSTSTVNFPTAGTVADLAFVPVGADGRIAIRNGAAGSVDVLGDVFGYVLGGTGAADHAGAYTAVAPARVLDTRVGTGVAKGAIPAHHPFGVPVLGTHQVPPRDVVAVVLNVIVTHPKDVGYITAWPTRSTRPATSNLNFVAGQTVANLAIVPVGSDGRFALYNGSAGTVDLVADVDGYIVASPPTLAEVPQTGAFSADDVSCASPAFCVAVGHTAVGVTTWSAYAGGSWTAPAELTALGTIPRVSCPVVDFCLATDGSHSQTYNGAGWSAVSSLPTGFNGFPDTAAAVSLACATPTFCLKIDGAVGAARWNGTGWSKTPALPADALELACGATTCMTIGDGSPLVYNGSTWTKVADSGLDTGFDLGATLSCFGSSCTAVGQLADRSGVVSTIFDGTSWTTPVAVPEAATGTSLACVSTMWCMSVGESDGAVDGITSYSIFNGSAWSAATQTATVDAIGMGGLLSCPTTTFCTMAENGALRTYDGHAWSATSALPGAPVDVSCAGASACLAVEEFAGARSWNGATWVATPQASGMGDLSAVSCPAANWCVAIGITSADQGAAVIWNGTTWSTPTPLSMAVVDGVSCSSTSFCVVLGGDSIDHEDENQSSPVLVARFTGSGWSATSVLASTLADARSVSCTSSTFCAAFVLNSGEISSPAPLTFNGSTWTDYHVTGFDGSDGSVSPVSCAPGTTTCLITAGDGTMIVHTGSGSSWTVGLGPAIASGEQVDDVSCAGATDCVAAGQAGGSAVVWTYDGAGWSAPLTAGATDAVRAGAISCTSGSFCAYVGS